MPRSRETSFVIDVVGVVLVLACALTSSPARADVAPDPGCKCNATARSPTGAALLALSVPVAVTLARRWARSARVGPRA